MSRPLHKRIYHSTVKPVLNFVTFSKLRHRRKKENMQNGIYNDKYAEIVETIEKEISDKNVVYIFQHQMFNCEGTECFNGGAERYVVDLAEVLSRYGLKPVLIQYGSPAKGIWSKQVKNLTIYGLPVKFEEYEAACRFFKNYRFVIYSGATEMWGDKLHPNILISHGITWDWFYYDANVHNIFNIIRDVDKLVSVDTNTISWFRTTFSKTLHDMDFKASYIPNYVDTSIYTPKKKKDDGKIYVTFPRRAAPERGYWLMSAALKPILDKYKNVVFNFVGYAHGEDIRNDIKRLEKDFPGRVLHCAVSPDKMPEVYQGSDISLIPTIYSEGTSLSCLEAQACGNVVISTNIGGLPNLVMDGYNGLLINPDSIELMKALDKVISDVCFREKLVKNAIDVAQNFDKKIWMQKWCNVIEEMMSKYSPVHDVQSFIKLLQEKYSEKNIMVHVSGWDFFEVRQQRPNHIFKLFAKKGQVCIFCSNTIFANPAENLYVIPFAWLQDVLSSDLKKILYVPFNYPYEALGSIDKYINDDTVVLYDLIDDFDVLEDEQNIKNGKRMFSELVKRKNTLVFYSADKLLQIALELGANKKRLFASKNAVNLDEFQNENIKVSDVMQQILKKKKPIVGYYGTFTDSWFNFDLLKQVVKNNPQYEFVLMGLKHPDKNIDKTEKHFKDLSKFDNFTYIPPVPYNEIPSYAQCWDVATIPFKINEITLSTSPLKLFEYMAMGLPIVTTPMPECELYKSVFIAKDAAEFEKQIAAALKAKDTPGYQKNLAREASENTWDARVNDMVKIIEKHYKK